MLDNNIKIEKKEATDFKPLPENIYQVELLDVSSEERPTYDTRLKPENEQMKEKVLNFQFTLLFGKDGNENLRGRNVWANFIQAFLYIGKKNGKNKTYRLIEALLGRELTQEEEANGINGEFVNSLIGKQCRVMVEQKTKDEKIWNIISKFINKEVDYPSLTTEEKENARVKEKEGEKESATDRGTQDLGKEYPQEEEMTIDVKDIPF